MVVVPYGILVVTLTMLRHLINCNIYYLTMFQLRGSYACCPWHCWFSCYLRQRRR